MKNDSFIVELEPQAMLSVLDSRGARVRCLEGSLWITEEHSRRDILLGPDQSYELAGKGRALLQAMGASRVSVEAPSGGAAALALGFPQPERRAVNA